jgi:hypothetical protein
LCHKNCFYSRFGSVADDTSKNAPQNTATGWNYDILSWSQNYETLVDHLIGRRRLTVACTQCHAALTVACTQCHAALTVACTQCHATLTVACTQCHAALTVACTQRHAALTVACTQCHAALT